MLKEYDITGKVVFITGAGRGIGKGIAQVLAEAGADVAINALTDKYVVDTARDIAAASGRRVLPVLADVTNSEGVQQALDQVFKAFGRIDVLVNNLGDAMRAPLVKLPDRKGQTASDEQIKKVIDINMTAAILCTRAVGPHMLERRSGKIINTSSYTAGRGGKDVVLYTLAKAAVVGFTRAQALEWAPYNIQINSIAPGFFPEPLNMLNADEETLKRMSAYIAKITPLGRAGQLREVGLLALYLASSASDYMTGQTLYLDGGLSL
ncbi:MAG: SDR family oxidoreductase [Deltaproteobacteria bacterium]|nr:SDR family oxidoreductase [Deltaproteobacteria bacterium]